MDVYSIPGFEEPFNSWSHFLAAFAFFCLAAYLLRPSGSGRKHSVSVVVFGFSCVFLFSMSGVYHLLAVGGTARYVLRILDHAGIYLLIAGTFTAVHGILFHGFMRWGVILIVWILAINGITLGTIFFNSIPEFLSLTFFLCLGWLGIFSGIILWKEKGLHFIKYLLFGGLAYTMGAILEFLRTPVLIYGVIGPHELFHLSVILGTTFHWIFIIKSIKEIDQKP
ncbi:MAG: PAQR family membrane homeostasis protein TrhA [bacterium]